MRSLKQIRIVLSLIFLAEAIVFVALGASAPAHTSIAYRLQVIPSAITASMGATLTWIIATLMLGRVYCSTVCPLGSLQDFAAFSSEKLLRRKKIHSYKPAKKIRYGILLAYVVLTIMGSMFGVLLEPWAWFDGIVGTISPLHNAGIFLRVTANATFGVVTALAALAVLLAYAILTGRDFCNHICPIGTALGLVSTRAALHIEIDPDKCISCLKCEDGCKSSCISVKNRLVDNTRCVKCFNCVDICPNNAIRYQANRNGVISPMMRRTTNTSPNV